jgi:hypothetical protein
MDRLGSPKLNWALFQVFMLALFFVEGSYLIDEGSNLRTVAAWIWFICSNAVLAWAFIYAVRPFFRRTFWSSRDIGWYLAAYFVPIGLVLFGINGCRYTQIDDEGLQEIVSAFYVMTHFKDLGIFKLGFLDYPARQFLLAAEPTVIFGRGIVDLRLGFAGLYLVSYLAFLTGMWRYLVARSVPRPMLIASLAAVSVSLGNYALLYSRLFEQTMVPLTFCMLLMAGILVFLERPSPVASLWMAWTFGQLAYSYTPALAVWALGALVLVYMGWFHFKSLRAVLAEIVIYGAVALSLSIYVLERDKVLNDRLVLGEFTTLNLIDWAHRFGAGFHAVLGLEESVLPPPLLLGITFALFNSLRRKDFRVLLICLWAAACVVASLSLRGYCWRLPEFDVHRAMIILPPLSLTVVMYLAANKGTLLSEKNERVVGGLMACCVVMMLLSAIYLPLLRRAPRAFIPWEETDTEEATMLVLDHALPGAKTIYVATGIDNALKETLSFFSPDTLTVNGVPPDGEHLPNVYVITYLHSDPASRFQDLFSQHLSARPFLQIKPE